MLTQYLDVHRSWRFLISWLIPIHRKASIQSAALDVKDLLAAGIHVISTMNVQHLKPV